MTSLAEELVRVETEKDEWEQVHWGELDRIVGMVWTCGDEVCGCSEPQIIAYFKNKEALGKNQPGALWTGTFVSDHRESESEEELTAKCLETEREEPEMFERITWLH